MDKEISAAEYSRQQLLKTALRLFAEYGIDAVSMRMINREAGQKNTSALHYHFGNKQGLIEALVEFIQEWFDDNREESLKKVEQSANEGNVAIRQVVEALIVPFRRLLMEESWGYDAVRFLARLEFDANPELNVMIKRFSATTVKRFKKLLTQCLPDIPQKLLLHRWTLCHSSITQSLADYKTLKYSWLGDLSYPLDELCELYIDYHAGGLSMPANGFSKKA